MTLANKLVLCGLLIGMAAYTTPNNTHADESAEVVKITASKFHFTPDHITVVKGKPVTLQLTSTDAMHGFLLRALKIGTDIKPGAVIKKTVTPMTAGRSK
jgi:cytochrome c oxidase subunit 2